MAEPIHPDPTWKGKLTRFAKDKRTLTVALALIVTGITAYNPELGKLFITLISPN